MAAQAAPRMYHSTAVLLPDGRVLSAGESHGSLAQTGEIFSPPYLFKGARPKITTAPGALGYGQAFAVSTPNAASIKRVALVKAAAVTHSDNFDQRYVDCAFAAGGGTAAGDRAAQRQPRAARLVHAVRGQCGRRAFDGALGTGRLNKNGLRRTVLSGLINEHK